MKKDLLGYRDIEAKGYGSRTTVWRNIKKGNFPPPDVDDGRGHPRWFPETVEKHKESLESYSPVQPKYLQRPIKHEPPKSSQW